MATRTKVLFDAEVYIHDQATLAQHVEGKTMCALREMQFCNTNVLFVTLCLSSIFLREPRGGKIFQGLDFPRVLLTIDQKLRDIKYFFCKTLGVISIKESIIND